MLRSLPILGCVERPQRASSSAFHVFYYGVLLVFIIGSAAILPVSAGLTLVDGRGADTVDLVRSWKPPPPYADIVDGIRQQQQQLQRIEDMGDGGSNNGNAVELSIADLLRSNGYANDRPPMASDNDEDDVVADSKTILPVAAAVLRSLPPPPQQQQQQQRQQQHQQHNNAKRQFKDASIGFPKTEARNMIRALINLRRYR